MCPTDSSTIRRLPSLHGVPLGSVPPLQRYCESATTSRCPFRLASFPSLGNTIYGLCPWFFAPHGYQDTFAHGPRVSFSGDPYPASEGMEPARSLKFLGGPPSHLPCSHDLGGTSGSGHLMLQCSPRKNNCEDSRGVGTNEAQLHGFCDHCLRFTAMVTHDHARLVSDCWPSFIALD